MTFNCRLPETHEEKIEDLNLIALRKYACAKVSNSKEWYLKCLECTGIDDCSCGRRVRDILENVTKPVENFEPYGRLEDKNEVFLTAWKTGDPLHYLVDHGHYKTIGSAGNSLSKWVKKTGLVSEAEYHEYCARTLKESGRKAGEKMTEKARKTVRDIFGDAKTDDEKRLAILRTSSSDTKVKVLYNKALAWAKQYKDLEQELRFADACKVFGTAENKHKTVAEFLAEIHSEPEEDEISLDEFLNETATDEAVDIPEEPKVQPENVVDDAKLILQREFTNKRKAVGAEIGFIADRISKLLEEKEKLLIRQEELLDQIKILDSAAEMFGMHPLPAE